MVVTVFMPTVTMIIDDYNRIIDVQSGTSKR